MIIEKFWTENFGPLGLTWGTWGQDLRRGSMKCFQNCVFPLLLVQLKAQICWFLSLTPKILKSFPIAVLQVGNRTQNNMDAF